MVDFVKLREIAAREREWEQTDVGALFKHYEWALISSWQAEYDERSSPAKLRRLDDALKIARQAFLLKVRGW